MDLFSNFRYTMQLKSSMRKLVILCIYFGSGYHESIFVPQNKAVFAGQRMTMNCPTNNGLIISEWKIQRSSTSTVEEVLYNNFKNKSRILNLRFGIDAESNLYVNSTELDDAGIYTCVVRFGQTQQPSRYSAHLIVFEAEPICNSILVRDEGDATMNNSLLMMSCFANFRGFWVPTIEWRLHDENSNAYVYGQVVTQGVHSDIIPYTRVGSNLTTILNSTKHEHYYSCRFYFTAEYCGQITNASNVPVFSYTWKSSAFGSLQNNSNIFYKNWRNTHSIYLVVVVFVGITLVAAFLFVYYTRRTRVLEPKPDVTFNVSNRDNPASATHGAYIGTDGTEYIQMNALNGQSASIKLPNTPGMFSLVEQYAIIDHSFRIPPPPQRQRI